MTIEDMKARAALKGGKCLSKEYIDLRTKLLWRCQEGHSWETAPSIIVAGGWCPACFRNRRKDSIEDMQELAARYGGKCLSENYINSGRKLIWQCNRGHTWKNIPVIIKKGFWCSTCREENRKETIFRNLCKIAEKNGGKLLSEKYVSNSIKLKWQCKEKHEWKSLPYSIKEGHWCRVCYDKKRLLSINEMHQIAERKGGKCLSEKYIGNRNKLKWRCEKGHKWQATPGNIKKGRCCFLCAREASAIQLTHSDGMEQMQKIAITHGGECLSEKYINNHTYLLFRCREGHKWKAYSNNIKNGTWCPKCGKRSCILTDGLKQMQDAAALHGGKCLAQEYINTRTKVKWKCARGHVWEAPLYSIKSGSWCRKCFYEKSRKNK